MKRIYRFMSEIYPVLIIVYVGTRRQSDAYLRTQNIDQQHDEGSGAECISGRMAPSGLIVQYIWLSSRDIGLLSHELIHAAMDVFETLGIPYSSESDEAFAYYYSYELKRIWNAIFDKSTQ